MRRPLVYTLFVQLSFIWISAFELKPGINMYLLNVFLRVLSPQAHSVPRRFTIMPRRPVQCILWAVAYRLGRNSGSELPFLHLSARLHLIPTAEQQWSQLCEDYCILQTAWNWKLQMLYHLHWHCSVQVSIFKIDGTLPFRSSPWSLHTILGG